MAEEVISMRMARRTFLLGLTLSCPILFFSASLANARIKSPQIGELVDSADLIVIGKVESVRTTPPELRRQIATVALIGIAASVAAFLLWRKRWSIAVALGVISLLGIGLFGAPFGTHRKVAYVSVSSTIMGAMPVHKIPVYYDDGFVCDVTRFDAGKEYLLFLKELSSGYALSWYDWSEWTVEDGFVQTERRTWGDNAAPIPLADFIARIGEARSKHEEK
jgi:hypothetical protein